MFQTMPSAVPWTTSGEVIRLVSRTGSGDDTRRPDGIRWRSAYGSGEGARVECQLSLRHKSSGLKLV